MKQFFFISLLLLHHIVGHTHANEIVGNCIDKKTTWPYVFCEKYKDKFRPRLIVPDANKPKIFVTWQSTNAREEIAHIIEFSSTKAMKEIIVRRFFDIYNGRKFVFKYQNEKPYTEEDARNELIDMRKTVDSTMHRMLEILDGPGRKFVIPKKYNQSKMSDANSIFRKELSKAKKCCIELNGSY